MEGPRSLKNPARINDKVGRIDASNVSPLNAWVRSLQTRLGNDAIIPWFDPDDGGVEARILWLLEAPGGKATQERGGSGFISCENNDQTAVNTWNTRVEAGVDRTDVVHWNAIPAYLGTDTKIRAANSSDVAAAGPLLAELLDMLPRLQCVILGGRPAQELWKQHCPSSMNVHVVHSPNPSPTNVNTRPGTYEAIVDAWRSAKGALK